ncbi:hypothetical protein L6452_08695 [Arctium lappa]|uniref:Uncharacterized protein n=1 Tax=Arctium lappa TaxID=4217 RepID=A0ACB9DI08_ARCLA|nr:hypothetical protein L6452_08695 [Arctium lappa]
MVIKYTEGAIGNESGVSDTIRFLASVDGCDLVLFRTSFEFEPEWFNLVCELYRKPVIPIGFLPQKNDDFDDYENWDSVKKWLDEQEVGLEHSGLPFFWVLRKSITESTQILPDGIQERLSGKKLGVEIPRSYKDGSFTSDSVTESVKLAMVSEEGEAIRANAREMKRLFGDEIKNDHYIDVCIQQLVEMRKP